MLKKFLKLNKKIQNKKKTLKFPLAKKRSQIKKAEEPIQMKLLTPATDSNTDNQNLMTAKVNTESQEKYGSFYNNAFDYHYSNMDYSQYGPNEGTYSGSFNRRKTAT